MSSDASTLVPTERFVSIAEYAAHRGCSDSYARRLRREQRLVLDPDNRRRVDWSASDAKLALEGDPLRGGDRTGLGIGDAMAAPGPRAAAVPLAPGASTVPDDGGVREAVRRERLANARIAELKLGEQTKELTRSKEVDRVVYTLARTAMESMRVIGSRLRAQLAAESDPAACEALIDGEIRRVCQEMQKASDDFIASHSNVAVESEHRNGKAAD